MEGGGPANREQRTTQRPPWLAMRNLIDATQSDVSGHHLTCNRYQTNKKLDANSPRKKMEAGSDRK
jgi:hypothetical protein